MFKRNFNDAVSRAARAIGAMTILSSLVLLCQCGPQQILVTRIAPGEADLPGVRRVAISDITGEERDVVAFSGAVAEGLVKSQRYEVLERSQLETILKEKGVQPDAAPGSALAGVLPASALVTGAIAEVRYGEQMKKEAATCYNDDGKEYKCTRTTRTGTATFIGNIRVVDTESGRVLLSKQLEEHASDQTSSDGGEPAPIDGHAMKDAAVRSAAAAFVASIAPHEVEEQVILVEDDDLPAIAQGNAYLRNGGHQESLEPYRQAVAMADAKVDLDPETKGKAYYALGVGLALAGSYDEAIEKLKRAYSLAADDTWLEMQMRVKQWQADHERTQKQVAQGETPPSPEAPAAPEEEAEPGETPDSAEASIEAGE